ncbi:MAG: hypothetical protein IPI35_24475 [Deltaproteobacteria bacterium]|nr:hypothetical protein [Deltaproteobacteria bacterium]
MGLGQKRHRVGEDEPLAVLDTDEAPDPAQIGADLGVDRQRRAREHQRREEPDDQRRRPAQRGEGAQ